MRKKAPPAQAYAQISRKLMLRAPAEKPAAARHHAQAYALQDISASRWRAIEHQARFLQLELWNSRNSLWKSDAPNDPIDVLQPGVALKQKGYKIQTVDSLPEETHQGQRIKTAGLLDQDNRVVQISRAFSRQEQFFTSAHELGHVVLGHDGVRIHRDRPMDQVGWYKDQREHEADWFAACFLMPAKQVRSWFGNLFLTEHFILTEQTAFALCTKPIDVVMSRFRTRRDLSIALARANMYGTRPMPSLVELFNVTPQAMAIRLEELDLVADPRPT